LSEGQINQLCYDLFNNPPIIFTADKKGANAEVQRAIERKIQEVGITIPLAHIKNDLYLLGVLRVSIQLKQGNLTLRIGGGYHTFEDWIYNNQKTAQMTML